MGTVKTLSRKLTVQFYALNQWTLFYPKLLMCLQKQVFYKWHMIKNLYASVTYAFEIPMMHVVQTIRVKNGILRYRFRSSSGKRNFTFFSLNNSLRKKKKKSFLRDPCSANS